MTKTNYTNLEKIKFLIENDKDIKIINKWLYIFSPQNSVDCYTKIAETLFGNEKLSNILEIDKEYTQEQKDFYRDNQNFVDLMRSSFYREFKGLLKDVKVKHEYALKKRIKKMLSIVKMGQSSKIRLYKFLYSNRYSRYSLEDFKNMYRSEDDKYNLKRYFLQYIENTDLIKRKQSKKYSVSRDMDKDVYYVTNEGKLAKIRKWYYLKHIKRENISKDGFANCVIPEGIIVKPMKLINKVMPKANENMKLMIASLFEGLKKCTMIIDEDFKTAYDPIYQSHQDTDGDKASNYSCMSGYGNEAEEFYGKINGCHVVRWELEDGTQVGRCIMYEWKGQRHFIRIYGLYEYHRTMINMLEAQMKEGDLFGRNKKIEDIRLRTTMDWETEAMYLDGNHYGLLENNGDFYMVADKYDLDCKTTGQESLESLLEDTSVCEHCGRRYSNDDGYWVNDYFYCCAECANKDGWYQCERCGEWVHEDDAIIINGDYYDCETCAERAGYKYDDYYNEWCDEDDLGNTDDGEYLTTKSGAADYYEVDEDEVEWDDDNNCWKRPEKEEEENNEENNETKGENKGEQND